MELVNNGESVWEGLPWITCSSHLGNPLEFISITTDRKIIVDVPECVADQDHSLLFSKQGWILLQKIGACDDSVFLVNPFTRVKIDLPPGPRNKMVHRGCFTTDKDGYPQCVFLLLYGGHKSEAIIKTVSPGDEEWTDHTFGDNLTKLYGGDLITVGDYIYSIDRESDMITALNVSDKTWKELPTPTDPPSGFVVEHDGDLLFVQYFYNYDENVPYMFSSFVLYRYDVVASSWKRVRDGDVKDAAWLYHMDRGCVATKGKGLKIYLLIEDRYSSQHNARVEAYDLLTGDREIFPVRFHFNSCFARWVDIR